MGAVRRGRRKFRVHIRRNICVVKEYIMEVQSIVARVNAELASINREAHLPEDMVMPMFARVMRLDQAEIEERIPERPPFNYFLHGAVIGDGDGAPTWIFAPCAIPLEKCDGHFPEFPMVPLHVLGGAMALTATTLVGHYMRETYPIDEAFFPLAIKGGDVSWTGGSRVLVPPVTTVVTAELLGYDPAQNRASTRTKVWTGDRAVALIDPLEFTVLPMRFFAAMHKRSSRARPA